MTPRPASSSPLRLSSTWSGGLFVAVAVFAMLDMVGDLRHGVTPWHLVLDLMTTGTAAAGAFHWWHHLRLRRRTVELLRDLDDACAQADRWRGEAAQVLPALGLAIGRQFERWGLTPDEQQIALLLMNGMSAAQIARARNAQVPAVREQMLSLYRKARVPGRAALSAFFLGDLLFLVGHGVTSPRSGTEG